MRAFILFVLAAIAAASLAALAYAPYLPRLLMEGVPSLVWDGKGAFAIIPPAPALRSLDRPGMNPETHLNSELTALMGKYEGMTLLAAKDGVLEIEYYAPGLSSDTHLNSYSMVKSLVAALVFKAMAEGRIGGLDTSLSQWLPDARGLQAATLRDLLTMRAGIILEGADDGFGAMSGDKMTDPSPNPFGELARLHFLGLEAIEGDLAVNSRVHGQFAYQNVNTALLAKVLEKTYGQPVEDLLREKLWQPAGAGQAFWRRPSDSIAVSAYCCLYARPRDFIRVGIYLASNGTSGSPFLPDDLWRQYLGLDIPAADRKSGNYGMHIRQDILDRPGRALQGGFTYLIGQNGQELYLIPERNLVVYRAGTREQLLHSTLYATWDMISQRRPVTNTASALAAE